MKCEEATALFLSAHDGDLSEEEKRAFEAHLADCETCEADWKAYLLTLDEVSGMYPLAPPEEFTLKVKQAIGRRSKGRFFGEERPVGMSFAIVSFILIVLVLLAYLYISSGREISFMSPSEQQRVENSSESSSLSSP